MRDCAVRGIRKLLKLISDGSDSDSKKYERGAYGSEVWCSAVGYELVAVNIFRHFNLVHKEII